MPGLAPCVAETVTVNGTGPITLSGTAAGTGLQTFASGFNATATFSVQYKVLGTVSGAWETNLGTYNGGSPGTLTRNLINSSTGSAINFSSEVCIVSCDIISDANGNVPVTGLPIGPLALPVSTSLTAYPRVLNALTANSFGTVASVANLVKFIPISVSAPITIANLGGNVATALASSLFIVGIYADVNGPGQIAGGPTGTPLVQTSQLSGAATGSVFGSASITLLPGYTYWLAYICSSTTTMHSVAASTPSVNMGYGYAGGAIYALTYANSSFALPNATGLSLSSNGTLNPAILQT